MTIAGIREKCKSLFMRAPRDLLILAIIILTALFSFGLGYLAGHESQQNVTPFLH